MEPVACTRHETAYGTWSHAEWRPGTGSPLDGAIERIWYFDGSLGASRERVFPDGTLELIVQLDTPHRPGDGSAASPFPPICVTGVRTTAEVVEAPSGRCRVLGVRLAPQAAYAVLGVPLYELSSLTVDLHDVLGRAAAELGTRVHAARDGAAAVHAAAAWASQRIADGVTSDATVARVLRAIATDGGTRSIAALDAWQGRSRTRFAATFRERAGISPKRFARIVRFDRALHAIAERRDASLGEIALAAGYYDQAHFTNEFRTHAGITPRAYLRAYAYPGTTSLVDDPEHFFQDAAS